jgi:hypothetical protein
MHALVSSVLPPLVGSDPLRRNPGLDHENRKSRQPPTALEANGGPLSARSLCGRPNSGRRRRTPARRARRRTSPAPDSATGAVAGHKPALEVDAPHVVGRAAMGEGHARGRALAAQPALHLGLGDRTRARSCSPPPVDQSRLPLEIGLHPQRSPGRMRRALADLIGNRVQMIERRSRAIEQTLDPHLLITRKPLVARFSVPTELSGRSLQMVPLASRPQPQNASAHPRRRSPSISSATPSSPITRPVTHVVGLFCQSMWPIRTTPGPSPGREKEALAIHRPARRTAAGLRQCRSWIRRS